MNETLHATAVAVQGAGVLLLGPPGGGKSDLALRLIDRGAVLIADDRVATAVKEGALLLGAPPSIAGLMEVRGVGIVRMPCCTDVAAILAVDLEFAPERLPDPSLFHVRGVELPLLALRPFDASAPIKVELAVAALLRAG